MITADSNVFVYLHDEADPVKQSIAQQVVRNLMVREAQIGLQVVGEFQNALRRKLKLPAWLAAQEGRNLLEAFDTFPPSRAASEIALSAMSAGRLSYWDALLLAAAQKAGCTTMLSEDMQDNETLLGVRVINPFTKSGLSDLAREALGL